MNHVPFQPGPGTVAPLILLVPTVTDTLGQWLASVRECIFLTLSQEEKWIGKECSGDEETEREIVKGKFPAALGKKLYHGIGMVMEVL